jgi:glutaredoxin
VTRQPTPDTRTVTLYGKPGCHLCEDARAAIDQARASHDFDLVEIDVSVDPALNREYGERIPVVEIDGVERFQYFVDSTALLNSLE